MVTRLPVSTISYNSADFLFSKLEELRKHHIISFWCFIFHYKEKDERKDHFHLILKPNKQLDTMDLQDFLIEPDLKNPDLPPLGCIDFVSSKAKSGYPDEWFLYSAHYKPYLAYKNESREYHYSYKDFVCSNYDEFWEYWNHALKGSDWATKNQMLLNLANPYLNPAELIENGSVPLAMACQVNAYRYMKYNDKGILDRGGKSGHD